MLRIASPFHVEITQPHASHHLNPEQIGRLLKLQAYQFFAAPREAFDQPRRGILLPVCALFQWIPYSLRTYFVTLERALLAWSHARLLPCRIC
jgi:hypothetical protein